MKRKSTIPKDQREEWRPEIARLWLEDNRTLSKVMEIMRDEHGCDATEKMYKGRLEDWGLKKKYTKLQKLIGHAHHKQYGGASDDDFLINGKPLRLSRIQRTVQRQGKKMTIVVQNLPDAMQNTSPHHQGQHMSSSISQGQVPIQNHESAQAIARLSFEGIDTLDKHILQESPESSASELILRHIDSYYRWYSVKQGAIYHHNEVLEKVFDLIDEGLNCVSTRQWHAFSRLHEACQGAQTLFERQHFQIIVQFSACFSQYKWSAYPELRAKLMLYLTRMGIRVLGSDHYLPKVLALMLREDALTTLSS